jgi:heme oxygenase
MLSRLFSESRMHQSIADADGAELLRSGYAGYLVKRYGFEAPLESALAVTPGISEVIDVQARQQCRMIVEDLVDLGMPLARVLEIPHAHVHAFRDVRDALGWLYVSDRSAATHDLLVRKMPAARVKWARDGVAARVAIGQALDVITRCETDAVRIIDAAIAAFEHQHRWSRLPGHAVLAEPLAKVAALR